MQYNNIIEKETKEIVEKIDFEQLRNKKVLITGASGIIGVYLTACLKQIQKEYNIQIYCWIKNNIDEKFKEIFENCKIIKDDICNIDYFNHTTIIFDYIIHAAGYGQPNKFMNNKLTTIKMNTFVTDILFLKYLKPNGKFLFISTSELYSGIDSENITEDEIGTTNTNHPRSCYIEGKRCGEAICYAYKEKGYDVKIARLSLLYGAGTKPNDQRVLNQLIEKGLTQNNITLMDSGDAIRTYLYVKDGIEMFWNILLHGKETLYNVGGKSKVSIATLANLIGSKLNKQVIKPNFCISLQSAPKVVNISIDRYLNEFKKTDFISLEEGITNTIEWQKQLYNYERD